MIDQRQLIKEIPSGKFHSAVMTSFSINLYYWEIQLLRSLSAKGINFVSALVDSDCLSDQLLKFSKAFSGRRPLDFSLHGYKMKELSILKYSSTQAERAYWFLLDRGT